MGYLVNKVRTFFWTLFYYGVGRIIFESIGRGSRFEGWVDMPQRGGKIKIGSNTRVCRLVEFSVISGARLDIGNNVSIGRGVMVNAHKSIIICDNVMIAEYVCIHDNNHRFEDFDILISDQGYVAAPIMISAGSWIGAHAVIVLGGEIGQNSILGAGSIVNKIIPDNVVAAGVPAKIIRHRIPKTPVE